MAMSSKLGRTATVQELVTWVPWSPGAGGGRQAERLDGQSKKRKGECSWGTGQARENTGFWQCLWIVCPVPIELGEGPEVTCLQALNSQGLSEYKIMPSFLPGSWSEEQCSNRARGTLMVLRCLPLCSLLLLKPHPHLLPLSPLLEKTAGISFDAWTQLVWNNFIHKVSPWHLGCLLISCPTFIYFLLYSPHVAIVTLEKLILDFKMYFTAL